MTATATAKGQIAYDASAALTLAEQAKLALDCAPLVIDSDRLLELAAQDLKSVKALQHQVEEQRTAITRPLYQALGAVNELFRAPREYLEQAEKALKGAILQFNRSRAAAFAAAQAAAEGQAQIERERLAREALQHTREAQQASLAAEQARQQMQAAQTAGDGQAALAAQADAQRLAAQAERSSCQAAAAAQTAEVITIAPLAPAPQRLTGIATRLIYSAEVVDLPALVRAVAEGQAPLQCLQADRKFLGAQARALQQEGLIFPGVQARAEHQIAASRQA